MELNDMTLKRKSTSALHIMINRDGEILESSQNYLSDLVEFCCKKFNMSIDMVREICPYKNPINAVLWLCDIAEVCLVDDTSILASSVSEGQIRTLQALKLSGEFQGDIPYSSCN